MLLDSAYPAPASIPCAALAFHRRLAEWNRTRASTMFDAPDWLTSLQAQYRMRRLESDFASAATASVRRFAREAPSQPERFSAWFSRLEHLRSSTTDALFARLADHATAGQLQFFLDQWAVADACFAELSALTQSTLATRGSEDLPERRGMIAAANGSDPLALLGSALTSAAGSQDTVWEALAVSNLMVAFAANRRFAYHAAGALAVVELTAAKLRAAIERGLARLALPSDRLPEPPEVHGWRWCEDVLPALVAQDPSAASSIAEGALSRVAAAARCFERCQRELDRIAAEAPRVCPPIMLPVAPEADAMYAN
jgi:Iron-containing redox enzyme